MLYNKVILRILFLFFLSNTSTIFSIHISFDSPLDGGARGELMLRIAKEVKNAQVLKLPVEKVVCAARRKNVNRQRHAYEFLSKSAEAFAVSAIEANAKSSDNRVIFSDRSLITIEVFAHSMLETGDLSKEQVANIVDTIENFKKCPHSKLDGVIFIEADWKKGMKDHLASYGREGSRAPLAAYAFEDKYYKSIAHITKEFLSGTGVKQGSYKGVPVLIIEESELEGDGFMKVVAKVKKFIQNLKDQAN